MHRRAQAGVKGLFLLVPVAVLLLAPAVATADEGVPAQRETAICGKFREPFTFWLWHAMTPDPDLSRLAGDPLIEAVEFVTADVRTLRGYKLKAHDASGQSIQPKGYVLMALGNAMIADRMMRELSAYGSRGYDAYVFDYRGYGLSEGKRRINAIIEDYREIVADLNSRYRRKMLYGVSLGGMVMMNVIGSGVAFDAAVVDSSPSRMSVHGCPERIDPVRHLSARFASRLLVITGKQDQVLPMAQTRELREQAAVLGARTVDDEAFAHPFMDSSYKVHTRRARMIEDHLLRLE